LQVSDDQQHRLLRRQHQQHGKEHPTPRYFRGDAGYIAVSKEQLTALTELAIRVHTP